MSTYYGYVDKDIDQQINWKTIGETVSKPFIARAEELKKERAAVSKNTRDILSTLSNPELTPNRNVNTLIIDGAVKFSEQQKAYDTLYKQGSISYNEYLQSSQNVKDQATMFSKIPKFTNERYETIMGAFKNGEVDAATTEGFQVLQDVLLNPNVTGFVMDKNGNGYLGRKEVAADGTTTITKDINGIQSLSNLNSLLGTFYIPKFDIEKDWTKNYAELKAKSQKLIQEKDPSVSSFGKIKTLDDIYKNNPDFQKSLKDTAAGVANDPYRASSVLMGTIAKSPNGENYKPVFGTPKKPNEVQIVVDSSGNAQYKLTDEQKKTVEDYLISKAKSVLSSETKVDYENQLDDAALERAKFAEQKRRNRKEEAKEDSETSILAKTGANFLNPKSKAELDSAIDSVQKLGNFKVKTGKDNKMGAYKAFFDGNGNEVSRIYDRGQTNEARATAVTNLMRVGLGSKFEGNWNDLNEQIKSEVNSNIEFNKSKGGNLFEKFNR